jgi:hypothetical protein
VPLYLDDNLTNPYIEIKLKGSGAFPKITFDRRF